MVFTAKLIKGAPIWRLWRDHNRVGGQVMGVQFHWVAGNDYVTEALTLEQINALRGNAGVVLEGHGHGDVVVPVPPAEPEDADDDDGTETCPSIVEVAAKIDENMSGMTLPVPLHHLSKRERRALRQQQTARSLP